MKGNDINRRRLRTRKAILDAASELVKQGLQPGLEEVAEKALISRATIYRYFTNIDDLLLEAALHGQSPGPELVFEGSGQGDVRTRMRQLEQAYHRLVTENEAPMRMMLAKTVINGDDSEKPALPRRQNRRSDLIEEALAPARKQIDRNPYRQFCRVAAMLIGIEALVVARDVLRIDEDEAEAAKLWALDTLLDAMLKNKPTN